MDRDAKLLLKRKTIAAVSYKYLKTFKNYLKVLMLCYWILKKKRYQRYTVRCMFIFNGLNATSRDGNDNLNIDVYFQSKRL